MKIIYSSKKNQNDTVDNYDEDSRETMKNDGLSLYYEQEAR